MPAPGLGFAGWLEVRCRCCCCCCSERLLPLCGIGGGAGNCCESRTAPPGRPTPLFLPFAGPNDSPYTLWAELNPPPPMLPPPNSLCALPKYIERGAPGNIIPPAFQFCIIMLERMEFIPPIPPTTLPPDPKADAFELRSHSSAAAAMACCAAAIW